MGYTHYWNLRRNISLRNFKKLTNDMKTIEAYINKHKPKCETADCSIDEVVTLHYANGKGNTVLYNDEEFCFNGDGSKGLDHESMHIFLGENEWSFCKTARKPYDLAVCLILLSLKYHIRSTNVSSDGDTSDWKPAFEMWSKIFPRRKDVMFKFKDRVQNHKVLDGSLGIYSLRKATEKILQGQTL